MYAEDYTAVWIKANPSALTALGSYDKEREWANRISWSDATKAVFWGVLMSTARLFSQLTICCQCGVKQSLISTRSRVLQTFLMLLFLQFFFLKKKQKTTPSFKPSELDLTLIPNSLLLILGKNGMKKVVWAVIVRKLCLWCLKSGFI